MDERSTIQKLQREITDKVVEAFPGYYLTGGTALAFYYAHRFSEDLDFFTQEYHPDDSEKVMKFIEKETGFSFELKREQTDPKLVPLKIYNLELKNGLFLKIDFVSDFHENIKPIKNGLHSIEDIYYRKIIAAIGISEKVNIIGKMIPSGRQAPKDFFDIYTLSTRYRPLSEFFLEYYEPERAELLFDWYKRFNRMNLQMDLIDYVDGIDTRKVFRYFDKEVLSALPAKLLE